MTELLALLIFVIFALGGYAVSRFAQSRATSRESINRRLASITETRSTVTASSLLKDLRLSQIPFLDALLSRLDFMRALVKMIRQAGIKRRAGEILLYIPLLFCVGFVGAQFSGLSTGICAAIGWGAAMIPLVVIQRKRAKRMQMFSEQLPEGLDLIRASLQAGHGFLRALQVVAEEFPDPMAEELREVAEEMRLGLPQREALYGLIQRLDDQNLPMLVVGVLITQESGGNLAEVLDNISHTIRERAKIQRDVKALTAQGRMSARLLTSLPFFVAGAIYLMSPEYLSPMTTTPMGRFLIAYAVVSVIIGHFVLKRVVRLETEGIAVLIFLVVFATFAAVTAGVLSGLRFMTAESAVSQRLRMLMPGGDATAAPARKSQRSSMRVLKKVLAVLGQYSVGGSEDSLTHTLSVAGMRARSATILFLGVRTLLSFGPALLIIVSRVSAGEPLPNSIGAAALAWFGGHIAVNLWLRVRARKRSRAILNALPDSLDLMVICLEAGLGLNATITRVGQERSSLNDPLGQEFSLMSLELRNGRSREEALRALSDRNGVDDLRSLTALVIQSDKLGASMARTLRVHADLLRTRRRQRAEEAARKLPIKMLFPLALFILPPLFTVTVGPAVLQIVAVLGGLGKN